MPILLSLALLWLGLAQSPPAPTRILFVGNSLTYENDLPGMVCQLARSVGRQIVCESIAKPDYGLEDHWQSGEARRTIAGGRWDIVVLRSKSPASPAGYPCSRYRWPA